MKQFLVITIDVEPDCSPDWRYSDPLQFKGVSTGIRERLQPLFNKYNIIPTYLINNVVMEDANSVEVFRNLPGQFELGTHLHPEFIEPQKEIFDYAGQRSDANCCFYEPVIEYEKIKSITRLFQQSFGYNPTSFRAGRFSAGTNTIGSLKKLGYKVDTSVTPHINWKDRTRQRPVDYRNAPEQPYFMGSDSIIHDHGSGSMLQVPVSIALKKRSVLELIKQIIKSRQLSRSLSKPCWLRPVFSDRADFRWIVENFRQQYSGRQAIVYNVMFHNVEVMPSLSPYSITEQDCSNYLALLEWFFEFCKQSNIQSSSLSALYDVFKEGK
jgi:hypothetical protein